jgi:cold shock CspA family protein
MVILSGIVSLFNDIHGNGIIEPENGSERIKFSYKDVIKRGFTLPFEGQHVEYELVKTINGPRTRNIVLKENYISDNT